MAALPVAVPVAKLFSPSWAVGPPLHLKLALGTASGFKGVHQAGKQWEARLWVAGKGTRVLCRHESAEECAAILAFFERFPCEIPTPKKGRAKPGKGQVCCERSVASLPCVTPQLRVVQPAGLRKKQRRAALRAARCMEAFSVAVDRIPLSAV